MVRKVGKYILERIDEIIQLEILGGGYKVSAKLL